MPIFSNLNEYIYQIQRMVWELCECLREVSTQASRRAHSLESELSSCHHLPSSSTQPLYYSYFLFAHTRTHPHTHCTTSDSPEIVGVIVSLETLLHPCVKDLPGFLHNGRSEATSQSHQILFIYSLLFVSVFLAHPELCLPPSSSPFLLSSAASTKKGAES